MFFVFDFSKSGWLQNATVTNMPNNKTAYSAQQYSHHQLPAYPIMFPLLNFGIGQSFVNSLQLIVDENGFFENSDGAKSAVVVVCRATKTNHNAFDCTTENMFRTTEFMSIKFVLNLFVFPL